MSTVLLSSHRKMSFEHILSDAICLFCFCVVFLNIFTLNQIYILKLVWPKVLIVSHFFTKTYVVFVLSFYGPVNPTVMSSAISLHNHTFTGRA